MSGFRRARLALSACALAALLAIVLTQSASAAGRIEQIRQRGYLTCGVKTGIAGFATVDAKGRYAGFEIDLCRALAAAIFASADRVRFVEVPTVELFLKSPDIDLVERRLTWTLTREASNGLMFGPIVFFDGEAFLVPDASPISSGRDLDGKRVCVDAGEDWADTLSRWGISNGLKIEAVVVQSRAEGETRFFGGACDAYAADESMLGAIRADAPQPRAFRILPEHISKEPLAPLVRGGDDPFFQLVRWTIFALIDAEELGVTSKTVGALRRSEDPAIRALVGADARLGHDLGVSNDWAYDIIANTGNYREIFARNIGDKSPIGLERGMNELWTRGGLLYAPAVR